MPHILLVEDDFVERECLDEAFTSVGLRTTTASNGVNALLLVEQHGTQFDAVLTDYHMPHNVTGAHVIAHLRELFPFIPMFLATGLSGAVNRSWVREHNVVVISKPYSANRVAGMVRDILKCPERYAELHMQHQVTTDNDAISP